MAELIKVKDLLEDPKYKSGLDVIKQIFIDNRNGKRYTTQIEIDILDYLKKDKEIYYNVELFNGLRSLPLSLTQKMGIINQYIPFDDVPLQKFLNSCENLDNNLRNNLNGQSRYSMYAFNEGNFYYFNCLMRVFDPKFLVKRGSILEKIVTFDYYSSLVKYDNFSDYFNKCYQLLQFVENGKNNETFNDFIKHNPPILTNNAKGILKLKQYNDMEAAKPKLININGYNHYQGPPEKFTNIQAQAEIIHCSYLGSFRPTLAKSFVEILENVPLETYKKLIQDSVKRRIKNVRTLKDLNSYLDYLKSGETFTKESIQKDFTNLSINILAQKERNYSVLTYTVNFIPTVSTFGKITALDDVNRILEIIKKHAADDDVTIFEYCIVMVAISNKNLWVSNAAKDVFKTLAKMLELDFHNSIKFLEFLIRFNDTRPPTAAELRKTVENYDGEFSFNPTVILSLISKKKELSYESYKTKQVKKKLHNFEKLFVSNSE